MNTVPASFRCKVIFEGFPSVAPRHYLLVRDEGQRFEELSAKILHDCSELKLDKHQELASLCWKDSDEDEVSVDSEDTLDTAMSYVLPDQRGFFTLRLTAKFHARRGMPPGPGPVTMAKLAAKAEYSGVLAKDGQGKVVNGVAGHGKGSEESEEEEMPQDFSNGRGKPVAMGPMEKGAGWTGGGSMKVVPGKKVKKTLIGRLKKNVTKRPNVTGSDFLCLTCRRRFPTELQANCHFSCHGSEAVLPVAVSDGAAQRSSYAPPTKPSTSTVCQKCGVKCRSLENLTRHDCEIYARKNPKHKRSTSILFKSPSMAASSFVADQAFVPSTTISNTKRFRCNKCGINCINAERFGRHDCAESDKRRARNSRNSRCRRKFGNKKSEAGREGGKRAETADEKPIKLEPLKPGEPIICTVCGRSLMNRCALASHMRIHINRQDPLLDGVKQAPESSFVCEPACGKWYAQYSSLYKHRRQCHFARAALAAAAQEDNGSQPEKNGQSRGHPADSGDSHSHEPMDLEEGVPLTAHRRTDIPKLPSPEIQVRDSHSSANNSPDSTADGISGPAGSTSHTGTHYVMTDGPYGRLKVEHAYGLVEW